MKTAWAIAAVLLAAGAARGQDADGTGVDPEKIAEAASQQEKQEPETPAPPARTKQPRAIAFDFKAWTLLAYDDNIIGLRHLQEQEFRAGEHPDRFRIESVDDFVATAAAEASLKFALLGREETSEAGGRVEAHVYERNRFVDYEEYRLWAAQRFGGSDRLGLTACFTPDRYNRELRDPVTRVFSSAFRDEIEYKADWRHDLNPEFRVDPFGGWRIDNYDAPFNFHDLRGWFAGTKLGWAPTDILEVEVAYDYSQIESAAGPLDPDYSYRQHRIETAVCLKPAKGLDLKAGWRIEVRDFTTTTDFERAGREDVKQRFTAAAAWRLSKRLEAVAEYRFYDVTSNRPNDNTTGDETAYMRNVVMVGMVFRY